MTDCEIRLARQWYDEAIPVEHIASLLGRHRTRVWDKINAEDLDENRGVANDPGHE